MPNHIFPEVRGQTTCSVTFPKQVEGKYVNDDFGLEMFLPSGLVFCEGQPFGRTVIVTGMYPSGGIIDIRMMNVPQNGNGTDAIRNASAGGSGMGALLPKTVQCKSLPVETTSIGGKNTVTRLNECSGKEPSTKLDFYMKEKDYVVKLGDRVLTLNFSAFNVPGYDEHIKDFEDSVKTIKFTK
jgi:hypothetical protein